MLFFLTKLKHIKNLEETDELLRKYNIYQNRKSIFDITTWFSSGGVSAEGRTSYFHRPVYKSAIFAFIYKEFLREFLESHSRRTNADLTQFFEARAYIEDLKINKKAFQDLCDKVGIPRTSFWKVWRQY